MTLMKKIALALTLLTAMAARAQLQIGNSGAVNIGGAPSGGCTDALTMNNSGSGAASGATFNCSAAETLSWNTIGAANSGANSNITSLTGLTTPLSPSQGGTGESGTLTGFLYGNGASAHTAATAAQAATLIQELTGCNTATNVFTPQASDCVPPSGGISGLTPGVIPQAGSSTTIINSSPQLDTTTNSGGFTIGGTVGEYAHSWTSTDTVNNAAITFSTGSGGDSTCPSPFSGVSYLCTMSDGISASIDGAAYAALGTGGITLQAPNTNGKLQMLVGGTKLTDSTIDYNLSIASTTTISGTTSIVNGTLNILANNTASSGSNVNSPLLVIAPSYWNGSSPAYDYMQWVSFPGTGTNPPIVLTLQQGAGSTGQHSVSMEFPLTIGNSLSYSSSGTADTTLCRLSAGTLEINNGAGCGVAGNLVISAIGGGGSGLTISTTSGTNLILSASGSGNIEINNSGESGTIFNTQPLMPGVTFNNATSGRIQLLPPTGALGAQTQTLTAVTGTLAPVVGSTTPNDAVCVSGSGLATGGLIDCGLAPGNHGTLAMSSTYVGGVQSPVKLAVSGTIQNAEGIFTNASGSCTSALVIVLNDCGTSAGSCSSPTTLATVTISAIGSTVDGTINSSTLTAGHYVAWGSSGAATCTSPVFSASASY
jgi:hypothetical protein